MPILDSLKRYAVLIAAVLGIAVGWMLHAPGKPVHEAAAPAQRQADGSIVLARAEGTTAPAPAPHVLPKGAKEERRVQVVVQPPRGHVVPNHEMVPDHFSQSGNKVDEAALARATDKDHLSVDSCDCPPVTVDLSLVRMPDKTRRVVASSPDGQILSGLDIPIDQPSSIPRALPWAMGAVYTSERQVGGFVDRDLGPFRLGAEVVHGSTGWVATGKAGIRF